MPPTSLSLPPALAVLLPVYWQGKGGGRLLGELMWPACQPGRETVMDGGWPPLLLLTCWLGPMLYSWDLGQERDAKRFKNILRNSLRCQPSCQVVLSKESQALHPYTHMPSGGIRSKSVFFFLLCFQEPAGKHQQPTVWASHWNYSLLRKLQGKFNFPWCSFARS